MNAAKKAPQKRVFWDYKEKAIILSLIVNEVLKTFVKVPSFSKLGSTLLKFAMEAQKTFPENRQRNLTTFAQLAWPGFEEEFATALKKAQDELAAAEAAKVPPQTEKPVEAPAGGLEELVRELALELLNSKRGQAFVKAVVKEFKRMAFEQARQELEGEKDVKVTSVAVQERPQGDELPRIVIAGLTSTEFNRLETKFKGRVEMRHIPLDTNAKGGFDSCKNAAITLVATSINSHKFMGRVKAVTENFERVDGGVASFERVLEHKLAG